MYSEHRQRSKPCGSLTDEKKSMEIIKSVLLKTSSKKVITVEVLALWLGDGFMRGGGTGARLI